MEPSPYLPTTRRFANPLYLRVSDVPELAGLDPDAAAHPLCQGLADRQTQPGSALVAGIGRTNLNEGLTKLGNSLGGDAAAAIFDDQGKGPAALLGIGPQSDRASRLGEFDCVADQVHQYLVHRTTVAQAHAFHRCIGGDEIDPFLERQGLHEGRHFPHRGGRIEMPNVEIIFAGLDPG